ncbi:MAG TPA: hypothetical protein VIJ71_05405 [Mycobacteriales bacterium]
MRYAFEIHEARSERAHRRHDPQASGPGVGRGGRGRGGRHGGRRFVSDEPTPVKASDVEAWLTGRLPDDWYAGAPDVSVDRDEITIIGTLPSVAVDKGADAPAIAAAETGRISRFREDTRETRMAIAREAEHRYDRRVSWGATAGDTSTLFTTASVPVMTRLRQPERQVLDTLVDAGVARSRSDALAWCVRLVGRNTDEWLTKLQGAMSEVEKVRGEGPG